MKAININPSKDFNEIVNELNTNEEISISFNLKEKDLNKETGKKILSFLIKLKYKKILFKITKPLPRCLFSNYNQIIKKFSIPKDCYECDELYTIKNEDIISCKSINKKGPKIYYMPEKNQIAEFFTTLNQEKQPSETCKKCLYFLRKTCDGLCFRI